MTKKDKNTFINKMNQRLRRSGITIEERKKLLSKIDGVVYSEASGLISRATDLTNKRIDALLTSIETKASWELTEKSAERALEITKDDFYKEYEGLSPAQKKAKGYDKKRAIMEDYGSAIRRGDWAEAKRLRKEVEDELAGKNKPKDKPVVSGFESSDPLNKF